MLCHKWKEHVTFDIIGRYGKLLILAVVTGTSREELWLQTRIGRGIQDEGDGEVDGKRESKK